MSSARSVPPEATDALRAEVAGAVFVPADPGYNRARQAWTWRARTRTCCCRKQTRLSQVTLLSQWQHSSRCWTTILMSTQPAQPLGRLG